MKNLKATPNYQSRTFTIREFDNQGKCIAKYRTTPMNQEEFDSEEMNTSNDWSQFLKTDSYYVVK